MIIRNTLFLLLASFILIAASTGKTAYQPERSEYALKAAFLYRFTDYIEWPGDENDNFTIGILGDSPMFQALSDIARSKTVKGKHISVLRYDNITDVGNCEILFVPHNGTPPLDNVLSRMSGRQVLIVTEQQGLGAKGAHINFIEEDNRLKFEINIKAALQSKIRISSQLLQHAVIVGRD